MSPKRKPCPLRNPEGLLSESCYGRPWASVFLPGAQILWEENFGLCLILTGNSWSSGGSLTRAEHEQVTAGDASWPRASSVPAREDRGAEGYWGVEADWSDKLRSSVLRRSHSIPSHPHFLLLALLSVTLCPMQEQNIGQEGLGQEAQWEEEPTMTFQTPLRNSSMCCVRCSASAQVSWEGIRSLVMSTEPPTTEHTPPLYPLRPELKSRCDLRPAGLGSRAWKKLKRRLLVTLSTRHPPLLSV